MVQNINDLHMKVQEKFAFQRVLFIGLGLLVLSELVVTFGLGRSTSLALSILLKLPAYLFIAGLAMALFRREQDRRQRLERMVTELETSGEHALQLLSAVIDAKDQYTRRHCQGVARWAVALAEELGLPEREVEKVRQAGLLHDIGKIALSEAILRKPGRLTPDEYRLCQDHPEVGYRIINRCATMKDVAEMVLYHQERYDGGGYPRGLSGEKIPLGARILSIADAYDAMRTDRVYRSALPLDRAKAELRRGQGTQFDPSLVDIFLEAIDDRKVARRLYFG